MHGLEMYARRVQAQKWRNPCLSDLCAYLQQPRPARDLSRIVCLDVFDTQSIVRRDIIVNEFSNEFRPPEKPSQLAQLDRKGRILLFEDISNSTVEEIGTFFDIDPWFFASYIHQTWRKTAAHSPTTCSLPSRDKKQKFLSLQYHRTVRFEQKDVKLRSLTRHCNHQRKAVILPMMGGEQIGLIQHCCSVLLIDQPGQEWAAIVLVDPPVTSNYIPSKRHGPLPPNLDSSPLLGGCEDFSESPIAEQAQGLSSPPNRSMLDELIHYWTHDPPPTFNPSSPTLKSFTYFPLKIVAAEWVNYIFVLGMSLREYELATKLDGDLVAELEKLNINLRVLQGWRRRILSTQAKMRRTIRFVNNHSVTGNPNEDWDAIGEDYKFLLTEVTEHGERLEAMVPLVTSAAALIESQRSLTEAANVTRLTVLALVFIPLSYVASLFSMAEGFAPGDKMFWVYFATAIPLAGVVGMVAKMPVGGMRDLVKKARGMKTSSSGSKSV